MNTARTPLAMDEVHRVELRKWDAIARVARSDESLRVPDPDFAAYARRRRTLAGVADFLGDLRGRRVLEYGCGLGYVTTLLARSGAVVSAFDLSAASIEVARRRAQLHRVADRIEFTVAPGEDLPYGDDSFDLVLGIAILHHLDVARAGPELRRVLRSGGRAAFLEPLGTNPLIAFARDHLPYPHKNPRGADRPLTFRDLEAWGSSFASFDHREIELLASIRRALGVRGAPALDRTDDWLLARFPALRRYCRSTVLTMVK